MHKYEREGFTVDEAGTASPTQDKQEHRSNYRTVDGVTRIEPRTKVMVLSPEGEDLDVGWTYRHVGKGEHAERYAVTPLPQAEFDARGGEYLAIAEDTGVENSDGLPLVQLVTLGRIIVAAIDPQEFAEGFGSFDVGEPNE